MSKKKIYTIANSHLDTVWCWDFETTVTKYLPATLHENFALFEKNTIPKNGKSSKNT